MKSQYRVVIRTTGAFCLKMLYQDLFHDWLNSDVRHCTPPNIDPGRLYIGREILAPQTITFLKVCPSIRRGG